MIDELNALLAQAKDELSKAEDEAQVEAARIKFLGKKGSLSAVLRGMGKLAPDERPRVGEVANSVKAGIEDLLERAKKQVADRSLEVELRREKIDVTLPGRPQKLGRRHPVSQAMDDIIEIFARLGFHVADGPDIEWDVYNFEKLCFPVDHPARDMQDTLFIDESTLPPTPPGAPRPTTRILRTHTSPVQIRAMLQARKPPIRVITPGKVYRCDSDITHTPMFHQVECLHVEEGVSMAHMRGTLDAFVKAFFGPNIQTRLRPSYFPFVEPGAEVDISHPLCGGKGCKVCKLSGWLEVLGAGMVNPDELEGVGIDSERYTGYAFGVGIDRLAMLRHGIDDLRLLFENDVRFLEQL
ncbi:MAG TPA: phenylalanine--tRNA ligase subunit alpha [Myxococcales bacterium]|nr:phenylalanine--tRNA ligase subunit alpha [Myxococcales bacterium]